MQKKKMEKIKLLKIPAELINHLHQGNVIIFDVRTPMEFVHGHIEGAENVPFEEIENFEIEHLCCDKPIVTCSANDDRSHLVCKHLQKKGLNAFDGGEWGKLQKIMSQK
nr:hypothetical protein [uncultured bacterium]